MATETIISDAMVWAPRMRLPEFRDHAERLKLRAFRGHRSRDRKLGRKAERCGNI
jgi:hypothetical protein|tara:strand:+ start:176 stop:340 length:165 start_codon:yes stop_codon:yes gene_type:complete